MISKQEYKSLVNRINSYSACLVAVSKTHSADVVLDLYQMGQRHFGENRTQELIEKAPILPDDIIWHFIGHLQSNKVKSITPFVDIIHSVDSEKLLLTINKEAKKNNRVIECLLQLKIAKEEEKYGFDRASLLNLLRKINISELEHIELAGIMGMATFTTDQNQIRSEFLFAKNVFDQIRNEFHDLDNFKSLSLGMSGDYLIALEAESSLVRVGSLLFGERRL